MWEGAPVLIMMNLYLQVRERGVEVWKSGEDFFCKQGEFKLPSTYHNPLMPGCCRILAANGAIQRQTNIEKRGIPDVCQIIKDGEVERESLRTTDGEEERPCRAAKKGHVPL